LEILLNLFLVDTLATFYDYKCSILSLYFLLVYVDGQEKGGQERKRKTEKKKTPQERHELTAQNGRRNTNEERKKTEF
jgi:hypothetical protein